MTRNDALFHRCAAASFALHAAFMFIANFGWRPTLSVLPAPLEIDLSLPLGPAGGGPGAARRLPGLKPFATVPTEIEKAPAPAPIPDLKPVPAAAEPDLSKAALVEPETAAAAPDAAPPRTDAAASAAIPRDGPAGGEPVAGPDGVKGAEGEGGYGGGKGVGVGKGEGPGVGSSLSRLPRLLNLDELLKNMKRFYPKVERLAGREGSVILQLEIRADGSTEPVAVVRSGGEAFDAAAREVARRMKFSPAERDGKPVPVRFPQQLIFRLE